MDAPGKSKLSAAVVAVLAGVAGLFVGYYWGLTAGGGAAPASAVRAETRTEEAPASAKLDVVVGRGYRSGSYTTFPVKLTNATGEALGYTKVTCELYDQAGEFVASEYTNWSGVPSGGTVSGEVASRVAGIRSASCRASA